MYIQVLNPTDTRTAWKEVENDYVPGAGEIIVFSEPDNYNEINYKIGNGVTKLVDLPFMLFNFPNGKVEKEYIPLVKSFRVVLNNQNMTLERNGRDALDGEYVILENNIVRIKENGFSELTFQVSPSKHFLYSIESPSGTRELESICIVDNKPKTHTYKFTTNYNERPVFAFTGIDKKPLKICDQNGFVQRWEEEELIKNNLSYFVYKGPIAKADDFEYTFYF